jgi:hypothetical protein
MYTAYFGIDRTLIACLVHCYPCYPVHFRGVAGSLCSDQRSCRPEDRPKLEAAGKTYPCEGAVSGYYNDPKSRQLLQWSQSTHTTTQYFDVDVNPRLECILGSTNMQPSTKLFIDGDYRFPVEGDSTPGDIEVRDVTFNTTNRSS